MPRFVHRFAVIEAVLFDGTPTSAMACAKAMGKSVKLSVNGDAVTLSIGRRKVESGQWIIPGKHPQCMSAEEFDKEYLAIDPAPVAAKPVTPPFAPAVRIEGEIESGDVIRDPILAGSTEDEDLDVLDIEGGMAICDSAWGEKRIPLARAILVRKGAA